MWISNTKRSLVLLAMTIAATAILGCGKPPAKDLSKVDVKADPPAPSKPEAALPSPASAPTATDSDDPMANIQRIASSKRYLLLALHRGPEGASSPLLTSAEALAKRSGAKAEAVIANVLDPRLAGLLKMLKVDPAVCPAPLLMVVSPNKLVTGTFTKSPSADALAEALLPPQVLAIRELLAAKKNVWVLAKGKHTTGQVKTLKALKAFLACPENLSAKTMAICTLNVDLAENAPFLKALKIDPKATLCTTIVLAPPLKILSKPILGVATKAALVAAGKPCASCGPGG